MINATQEAWTWNLIRPNQVMSAPFACLPWQMVSALSYQNVVTNFTRSASLSGLRRKPNAHFARRTFDKMLERFEVCEQELFRGGFRELLFKII